MQAEGHRFDSVSLHHFCRALPGAFMSTLQCGGCRRDAIGLGSPDRPHGRGWQDGMMYAVSATMSVSGIGVAWDHETSLKAAVVLGHCGSAFAIALAGFEAGWGG